jgi:HlyD family secretion protein
MQVLQRSEISGMRVVLLDGKALRRAVKTGATSPQGIRVEQGLVGGEDLITNPPPGLKNGDAVRQKAATL